MWRFKIKYKCGLSKTQGYTHEDDVIKRCEQEIREYLESDVRELVQVPDLTDEIDKPEHWSVIGHLFNYNYKYDCYVISSDFMSPSDHLLIYTNLLQDKHFNFECYEK